MPHINAQDNGMCTVTYIAHEKGFWLTSNRDEAPNRSPKTISKKKLKNGATLLFPRDTKAGGTWIAAATDHRVACLLNGAFEKHAHRPPYRVSRGLMVLDFFNYPSPALFFQHFDFEGIEPFTMIIVDKGQLLEFRWDGSEPAVHHLPASGKFIWSSATLYPAEIKARREQIFEEWLERTTEITPDNILNLHRNGRVGDPRHDFIMNRDNLVRTVSITHIGVNQGSLHMQYADLLHGDRNVDRRATLSIQPIIVEP